MSAMDQPPHAPLTSGDRLWSRLMAMAEIGARADGGVDRQALTAADRAGVARLVGWGRAAGLVPALDRAGNVFLTLAGTDRSLPPVLIGSHLDSQPTGGKFDGAFGVLAAFEVLETLAAAGITPPRDVTLVAWMNEEGSRYAPGMMGSEVFAGVRSLDAVRATPDADGIPAGEELDRLFAAFPDLEPMAPGFPVHAYVEPHIEQASVLEGGGETIGTVTGIQGKKTWEITIGGTAAHAGTEPMERRRDAVQAFARMALAMQALALGAGPDIRFTIGRLTVTPNAPSVVPERAVFRIDLRHPDNAVLDRIGAGIEAAARAEAAPCAVTITRMVDAPANGFDPDLMQAIRDSAASHGHPARDLLSAAGHDARHMAGLTRAAMIFIPCRGGISHHPDEWAEPAHVAAAAQILCDVALFAAASEFAEGASS